MVFLSEQQSPAAEKTSLKHQLLQVIVRVAQYRMILTGETRLLHGLPLKSLHFRRISGVFSLLPLTDYLNNLSPDSKEYEDTQGTVNTRHILCTPPESSRFWSSVMEEYFGWGGTHRRANLTLLCLKEVICNLWKYIL